MKNLIPTLKYVKITLKHKAEVFKAGLRLGVPLRRLILHDISKLTPVELPHYGRQFFGDKSDAEGFIKCWMHHQHNNDHHWEYWIPISGHNRCTPPYPDGEPIPMSDDAIKEMIADWIGASTVYGGAPVDFNNWKWFEDNIDEIVLHDDTRRKVMEIVERLKRKK